VVEEEIGMVLDRFVEGLFRLMLDHHRTHVLEMDLTLVQAQAIALLRGSPFPTSRLADSLGISAPAMTQLTDRLIRKRLIERRPHHADRRTVIIALTEQGQRVVDRFRKRRGEVFAEVLSRLNDLDRAEVVDALGKVVQTLEGHGQGGAIPTEKSIRIERSVGQTRPRTAVQPAEASKKLEQGPLSPPASPPVRRMRIEWD
jgi:DNA-binding MarR family transcriptional regulator